MKKSFFVLLLAAPAGLFAQTAGSYKITGRLKNIQAGWVYLMYVKNGQRALDSAQVNNGAYLFAGKVTESLPAILLDVSPAGILPAANNEAQIYLTPESFTVTHVDSFSHVQITGSVANTEFEKLQDVVKPYSEKETALLPRYRAAQAVQNTADVKAIMEQAKSIDSAMKKAYGLYAKDHPHSPVAFYALEMYATDETDPDTLQPLFDGLDTVAKHSTAGKTFQDRLTVRAKTSIGKDAMDFTQNDTLGKPVTLSSFRGKYILLDFWASWCPSCMADVPRMKTLLGPYHGRRLAVLSISTDSNRESWQKAVARNQMTWPQALDDDGRYMEMFGIMTIPHFVLLNADGLVLYEGDSLDAMAKPVADALDEADREDSHTKQQSAD